MTESTAPMTAEEPFDARVRKQAVWRFPDALLEDVEPSLSMMATQEWTSKTLYHIRSLYYTDVLEFSQEVREATTAQAHAKAFAAGMEEAAEIAMQGHCTSSGCDLQTTGHSNLCPIGIAAAIRARAAEGAKACEHEWVSMRNKAIKSGEICVKCNMIRAEPAEPEEHDHV